MKTTKRYTFKHIILLGLILSSTVLFASKNTTTVITGKVIDSNKQALNYATATLLNPETMTIISGDMCDSNGNFIIENVKPGKYILSIRMVGYSKTEIKNIEITPKKNVVSFQSIAMKESVVPLDELLVVANRKNENNDVILSN